MPHLSSNIMSTSFCGSIRSRASSNSIYNLIFNDFIPRASELLSRKTAQGGNKTVLNKQIQK